MSIQHLKEAVPSRKSSGYTIFPLVIYSPQPVDEIYFIPYHWHEEIEIIYIETGEFIIHINGIAHHAKSGDIFFINSAEIHQIAALTKISSHHAMVFDPKIIRFEWHDPSSQKYITPLIKGRVRYPTHINDHTKVKAAIGHEIKEAANAFHQGSASWAIVAKASLLKMIALLINDDLMINIDSKEDKDNEKAIIAKTIMTYIQENYMNKITLDELATLANMSTPYFCKFFKSMFDKTAVEYMNEYRIEKACLLLTQTDDKIIDIAFLIGFDNFSYFIRKFKQLKGLTPSAYRENGKG